MSDEKARLANLKTLGNVAKQQTAQPSTISQTDPDDPRLANLKKLGEEIRAEKKNAVPELPAQTQDSELPSSGGTPSSVGTEPEPIYTPKIGLGTTQPSAQKPVGINTIKQPGYNFGGSYANRFMDLQPGPMDQPKTTEPPRSYWEGVGAEFWQAIWKIGMEAEEVAAGPIRDIIRYKIAKDVPAPKKQDEIMREMNRQFNAAGIPVMSGLFGMTKEIVLPTGTTPTTPDTWQGDALKMAAHILPDIGITMAMPEVKAAGWLGKFGIKNYSKFGIYLGGRGMVQSNQSRGDVLDMLQAGAEGFGMGVMYDGFGAISGKIGEGIANKVVGKLPDRIINEPLKGVSLGGPQTQAEISQALSHNVVKGAYSVTANALIFGGYSGLDEVTRAMIEGGTDNVRDLYESGQLGRTVLANTVLGLGLGMKDVGRAVYAKGMNSFIAADKEIINRTLSDKKTAEEYAAERDAAIAELNKMLANIPKSPERDKQIEDAQKRLGLPTSPEVILSNDATEILSKLQQGQPVANETLEILSSELYSVYKGLSGAKESNSRRFTTKQINDKLSALSELIETVETVKNYQAEKEEFISGAARFQVQAATLDNMASLKAMGEQAATNPTELKRSVEESALPQQAKQELTQKIDEVAFDNDPRKKATDPIVTEIEKLQTELDQIDQSKDSQVRKDARKKPIQAKIGELKRQVEEVYSEPEGPKQPEPADAKQPATEATKELKVSELTDQQPAETKPVEPPKAEVERPASEEVIPEGIKSDVPQQDNQPKPDLTDTKAIQPPETPRADGKEKEQGLQEVAPQKTESELTKEKHNKLFDAVSSYNKANNRSKKKMGTQRIVMIASELGYSVGTEKGGNIVVSKDGKPIRKIATPRNKSDIDNHKILKEYSQEFQDFVEAASNGFTGLHEVDMNMPKAERDRGLRDILAGKRSAAANDVLDVLENMYIHHDGLGMIWGTGGSTHRYFVSREEVLRTYKAFKEELSETELKQAEEISQSLAETIRQEGITAENIETFRDEWYWNPGEFETVKSYLENEKANRESNLRNEVSESSKADGQRMGQLEKERTDRIEAINSEIAALEQQRQSERLRAEKANSNVELPLGVEKSNELFSVEQNFTDANTASIDKKIAELQSERNLLESRSEEVAKADANQTEMFQSGNGNVGMDQQGSGLGSKIPTNLQGGGKVIKASDIVSYVSKALGIPIRVGKIRVPHFAGIYKNKAEVIRLREANDLKTLSHEMAHHFDKKLNISNSSAITNEMKAELKDLDYNQNKRRVNEGFAEFLRHYLSTGDAKKLAPKFFDYFENSVLKNNHSVNKVVNETLGMITGWRQQGAFARAWSMIDMEGAGPKDVRTLKEKIGETRAKLISKTTDRLFPIKYAVGQIIKEGGNGKQRPSDNPYEIASATSKTGPVAARQFVLGGTFNPSLEYTGKSLKDVLAPVSSEVGDAVVYAFAKRALNLHGRGIDPGLSRKDAAYIVNNYSKPQYETFAKELTEWSGRVLDYLIESGGLSKESADLIRQANPVYIMLKRSFAEGEMGSAKGYVDLASPIKTIRGSGRDILNPLNSMITQVEQIINVSNKVRVARALANMADKYDAAGKWIEKIPPPVETKKAKLDDIKKQIEAAGGDLSQADMDAVINIFSQSGSYGGKDNIVSIIRNGKREYYQLHPMLYDAMKGMDNVTLPLFLNYTFGAAARIQRLGATGLRAGFGLITNPARDVATAGAQSNYKHGGRVDKIAKGIYNEISGKGKYINEFHRSGVEMAQPLGGDRKMLNNLVNEALANTKTREALGIVKHPIEGLRKLFSITEGGVRYAEFEAAMKKYEPLIDEALKRGDLAEVAKLKEDRAIEATNAGNEITVNFKRAGTYSAIMNQIIPFFNPATQGLSKFGRTVWEHPVRSGIRGIAGITIPTLALWWLNKDEEWYKELPDWQKYGFWNFKIGETMIRIPKPFEWGYVFGALPEAAANSIYANNPEFFKDAVKETAEAMTPPMMPENIGLIGPALEVYYNWDGFRDAPIIPRSLEGLEPAQQYQSYTSGVSKEVGEILNVSPLQIDHLLSGYTGGLATDIIKGIPGQMKEKADWPVVGRLFTRKNVVGFGGKSVTEFFEKYKKFQSVEKTINTAIKNAGENVNDDKIVNLVREQLKSMPESIADINKLDQNTAKLYGREIPDSVPIPKNIKQKDIELYVIGDYLQVWAENISYLRKMQKEIDKLKIDPYVKAQISDSINSAAARYTRAASQFIDKAQQPQPNN